MGDRGPAPEPYALRLLKKTNHKPINDQAPQLPEGIPVCPDWLSEEAAIEWDEIVKIMSMIPNWLTEVNKTTLAGHCHWYAVWKAAEEILMKDGRYYDVVLGVDDQSGEIGVTKKLHPLNKVSREAWASMVVCDKELGITPARGSSVRVPHGDSEDEQGLDRVGA
jgi:P27 family predicted phage terminase small subunit